MRLKVALAALACAAAFPLHAAPDPAPAAPPKIALVLSGGGARGLAAFHPFLGPMTDHN